MVDIQANDGAALILPGYGLDTSEWARTITAKTFPSVNVNVGNLYLSMSTFDASPYDQVCMYSRANAGH